MLMKHKDTGKILGGLVPWQNRANMAFATMEACPAWKLTAERKALDILAGLVKPHIFEAYMLCGQFIETSERSGITYMFRRLRPTLAIKATDKGSSVLCGLCLHPIGYYANSWAGVMVPTDEVVAHLMLMRGDEHYFWKQANQHPAWHPAAGL